MPLIDAHLELQPLVLDDAGAILTLVNENRAQLTRYLYWADTVNNLNDAHRYLDQRINSGQPGRRWFGIYFKQRLSGVFAVKTIQPNTGYAELGYWLGAHAQGHNIINRVIEWLPQLLDEPVKGLEIHCLNQNAASIAVATKAGAVQMARIRNSITLAGEQQDLLVFRRELNSPNQPANQQRSQ